MRQKTGDSKTTRARTLPLTSTPPPHTHTQEIREIEKEGGRLHCSIQKMGHGSGGCLYSSRSDGHFNFFEEDFEGFDKTTEFKVVKMHVDEKARRIAKEKEDEDWRQKWLARQGPKNEVILEDLKKVEGQEPDVFGTTKL